MDTINPHFDVPLMGRPFLHHITGCPHTCRSEILRFRPAYNTAEDVDGCYKGLVEAARRDVFDGLCRGHQSVEHLEKIAIPCAFETFTGLTQAMLLADPSSFGTIVRLRSADIPLTPELASEICRQGRC